MSDICSINQFTYAVCIGTYLRPEGLRALLAGLARQDLKPNLFKTLVIVIVDNDASGSARDVVAEYTDLVAHEIRYVIEPTRGIAQVRNRAVREAGSADYIIFIDDDEVPSPKWLTHLISAQCEYHADVVNGSVTPIFPDDTHLWMRQGWPFYRREMKSGQIVDSAACNNVLYRTDIHRRIGSYNEDFALTGGEDSQFFRRVHKAGYRIVTCNEAAVAETIPTNRANIKWLIRRGYQFGCTQAQIERSMSHSPFSAALLRTLKGASHVIFAIIFIPFIILIGRYRAISFIFRSAQGLGMIVGSIGITYEPYR